MTSKRNFIKKSFKTALLLSLIMNYTVVANAYSESIVSSKDGKPMFEVLFGDEGEISGFKEVKDGVQNTPSSYTLKDNYKAAIGAGLQYWATVAKQQAATSAGGHC